MEPDKLNWINQAVNEVGKILRHSVNLMHSTVLPGGTGVVMRVDEHELDRSLMPRAGLVYAGVYYARDERAADDDAAGQTDHTIDVVVHLEGKIPAGCRNADKVGLLRSLQRAASTVNWLANHECRPGGTNFDNFCSLSWPIGGVATSFEDESGFHGIIETGIRLQVTLVDD